MSLKDQIKNDAKNVFLNTDEFAEYVTYLPYGGKAKKIRAIVIRQGLDPIGEDAGRSLHDGVEVMVARSSEDGILSVNKGFDEIVVSEQIGGLNQTLRVVDILKHDEGMWHLLCHR